MYRPETDEIGRNRPTRSIEISSPTPGGNEIPRERASASGTQRHSLDEFPAGQRRDTGLDTTRQEGIAQDERADRESNAENGDHNEEGRA